MMQHRSIPNQSNEALLIVLLLSISFVSNLWSCNHHGAVSAFSSPYWSSTSSSSRRTRTNHRIIPFGVTTYNPVRSTTNPWYNVKQLYLFHKKAGSSLKMSYSSDGQGSSKQQKKGQIVARQRGKFPQVSRSDLDDAKAMYIIALDEWSCKNSNIENKDSSSMVQHMYNLHDSGHIKLKPYTSMCNAVINTWINSVAAADGIPVAWKAQQMLTDMENSNFSKPDTKTYNIVINAWAKSGQGVDAAEHAEKLLHKMLDSGKRHIKPDVITYGSVIHCWAKSGHVDAAIRAERILEGMIQLGLRPNTQIFTIVIYAWARSSSPNAAYKAKEILSTMEQQMHMSSHDRNITNNSNDMQPNGITYGTVINALAKSGGGAKAAMEAEQLLDGMHQLYDTGINTNVKPTVATYLAVIDSWAKSGHATSAERADAILANLIRIHQSDPIKHVDLRPNTSVYNTVMNAWAKCGGGIKGALRAQEILTTMEQLYKDGNFDIKPDKISYRTVMNAFAKSGGGGVDSAVRTEQLLYTMQRLYEEGDVKMKPDVYAYGSVIALWARADNPERAEHVLTNMIRIYRSDPIRNADLCSDAHVFSSVISAYAKLGGPNAANKAQAVLSTMEHMCKNIPNAITYTTVIKTLAMSGGGADAAVEAEKILQKMNQLYNAGNVNVKPDVITYNAVINCWAQSNHPNATMRAESILTDMIWQYKSDPIKNADLSPDTQIFSTVINVWAQQQYQSHSGNIQSSLKAQALLTDMEEMYMDGITNAMPNSITYTTVIKAWAKSGGGVRAAMEAEKLLQRMNQLYDNSNYVNVKPDIITYNAVINCWAQSNHPDAAKKAERVLVDMIQIYKLDPIINSSLKPNTQIFNSVINACAKSPGDGTAALRVRALQKDMEAFSNGPAKEYR